MARARDCLCSRAVTCKKRHLVAVKWPNSACSDLEKAKEKFLQIAEDYTWINPHLSLDVDWTAAEEYSRTLKSHFEFVEPDGVNGCLPIPLPPIGMTLIGWSGWRAPMSPRIRTAGNSDRPRLHIRVPRHVRERQAEGGNGRDRYVAQAAVGSVP